MAASAHNDPGRRPADGSWGVWTGIWCGATLGGAG